jgi:hypothetical protein
MQNVLKRAGLGALGVVAMLAYWSSGSMEGD